MSETLAAAREHARASADALDDPEDLDHHAVHDWLRRHAAFRDGVHHWVLVDEALPPLWQERACGFASVAQARDLLRRLSRNQLAQQTMRQIVSRFRPQGRPVPDEDVQRMLAELLYSRQVWVIEARQNKVPAGKTDPAVYQQLNGKYATQVDFAYLGQWEGGQWLRGYVPFLKKTHKVAGRSGMTIATGFDIGQKSEDALTDLGFSADLTRRLLPYTSHPLKGMTRADVLKLVAKLGPVPVITKDEADTIDRAVHGEHLESAIASWNTLRQKNVPAFRELPSGWQTVLFSRTFHQGPAMPKTSQAKAFYTAATAGKWSEAVEALRNYPVSEDWYKDRVGKEARLLASQLPAPVTPPFPHPAPPLRPP